MRRTIQAARRGLQVASAFLRLGLSTAIKYPFGFATQQLQVVVPVLIYFFIARFVETDSPDVGGDYFTFVMIGLVGMQLLNAGLRALSNEIEQAVSRGWFEMILMEPVPWSLLPFAMSQWPVVNALLAAGVVSALALLLGAVVQVSGIGVAVVVGVLGILAGLAIGAMAASVKVLAKRGDPLLTFYSLGALIFSGVYYPIDQLPDFLQPVSALMVHTYVISGLRLSLMGEATGLAGPSVRGSLLVLAVVSGVLLPLSVWVFGRAMNYGRKMGLLSGY